MPNPLENKLFNVEHALNMYASSYICIPAFAIYEADILERISDLAQTCHIYMIGLTPKIKWGDTRLEGNLVITTLEVADKTYELDWPLPTGWSFHDEGDNGWYVCDPDGQRRVLTDSEIGARLANEHDAVHFEVLYIGQAYGDNGSRSALDRLKKHDTLQKIAVQGIPQESVLTLLMLEILPANRMVTIFNPWAKDFETSDKRISDGLDKLFDTTAAERTTLYEASLIRYFQPRFNKEFKNSFPSTNMKLLADCYNKDIAAVVAEICFDDLPFKLFSDKIPPAASVIAKHNLHDAEDRRVFFN